MHSSETARRQNPGADSSEHGPASHPACPACASRSTSAYISGTQDAFRILDRAFVFYLCGDCRLRFQLVGVDEAAGLYGDIQEAAKRTIPASRREIRSEADVLRHLARWGGKGRLLDVGSGDGWLLAAGREAGFDCLGVDVSSQCAEVARKRSGVPVLVGQLDTLSLPPESFDYVNLDVVLMYVPEPQALLACIRRLLKPGGICRIHEYDPDSLTARRAGKRYWMYAPTHVSVWPKSSVEALARSTGFSLVRTYAGTEATLSNWLATRRDPSPRNRVTDCLLYLLRKLRAGRLSVGADTSYYLRKSP